MKPSHDLCEAFLERWHLGCQTSEASLVRTLREKPTVRLDSRQGGGTESSHNLAGAAREYLDYLAEGVAKALSRLGGVKSAHPWWGRPVVEV
jgi:hypothetical protein